MLASLAVLPAPTILSQQPVPVSVSRCCLTSKPEAYRHVTVTAEATVPVTVMVL